MLQIHYHMEAKSTSFGRCSEKAIDAQGDLNSLVLHERLPELPVAPRQKPHTGTAARENQQDAPVIAPEGKIGLPRANPRGRLRSPS